VFILAGKKTVIAVFASFNIDYHGPFSHQGCSSPLQDSICTRQELAAWLCDFSIIILPGVS
jgi:hypothetical protein